MYYNIFLGIGRTGSVFHLFRLFHLRGSEIAGRVGGIPKVVVIDLDGLWAFSSE